MRQVERDDVVEAVTASEPGAAVHCDGAHAWVVEQAVGAEGSESEDTALPEHAGDLVKNRLRVRRPRKYLVSDDHIE